MYVIISFETQAAPLNPKAAKLRIKQLQRLLKSQPHSKFKKQRTVELRTLLKQTKTKTQPSVTLRNAKKSVEDAKIVAKRKARLALIAKASRIQIPTNFKKLHPEERAAIASKIVDGIYHWMEGPDSYSSAKNQFYASQMLKMAKVLGVQQTKPRTMYRRLTFSAKSFHALQENKPIKLMPRQATSWCAELRHCKALDLPADATDKDDRVTFLIKTKVSGVQTAVADIFAKLKASCPKNIEDGHKVHRVIQGLERQFKSEREVLVAKNGGLKRITKKDVALANFEHKWLAPKSAHDKVREYVTWPKRQKAAYREYTRSSEYKALDKERDALFKTQPQSPAARTKWHKANSASLAKIRRKFELLRDKIAAKYDLRGSDIH